MWRRRTATVLAMALVAAAGWSADSARAGVPGEAIVGDFNGDDLPDTVVLGAVSPNFCSTIVQYGSAPGVYLPPVVFTYLTPGGTTTPDCPDIGAAADLNGDGLDDLGVGWSRGAPASLGFNRLILSPPAFQPLVTYTSRLTRPAFVGVGMFTAGARPAPYAIGPGGLVSAVLVDTTMVPGPIQFCSVDTPTAQLADWSRNGIQGVLLSYTNACADGSNGVVRVRGDGSVDQLELDPTGRTRWTARVIDADGDRFPDVRTVNQTTGEVSYFVNSGGGGTSFLVRAPDANTDRVNLTSEKAVAIDVLDNDFATRWASIVITTPPRYGTVQVLSDGRVLYRPDPRHGRTDRFTYQLREEGRRSSATVYLRFPD